MPTTLEQLQYGFDRDSRRTWRQRAATQGWDNAYVYDSLSQVIGDDRGDLNLAQNAIAGIPSNGSRWQYDETGNWHGYQTLVAGAASLTQSRMHDKGNRLMEVSNATTMRTDRAGRMLKAVPGPGADWGKGYQITWDAWSRIVGVASVEGETVTPVAAYAYDGLTRRITRYTNEEAVTLHSYFNDEWRPVEERKDSGTTASASYLWGSRHRDDLVRRDRAIDGSSLNESRYVLMDYFSPASITDASGDVTERYQFSAFGLRTILNPDFTVRSDSECGMEFAFQGQFEDAETGWLDYGYRYYLPALGRWACKDPIGKEGGLNLYGMVHNYPVNQVDHLGLIGGSGIGGPVPWAPPPSEKTNAPSSIQNLRWLWGDDSYLGEETYWQQRYPNLLQAASTFFIAEVNLWVVNNCGKSPYPKSQRLKITTEVASKNYEWSDGQYGDKPVVENWNDISDGFWGVAQLVWKGYFSVGTFGIDISTPVNITYEKSESSCVKFQWETTMYIEDNLGYNDIGIRERKTKRAKYKISGLGACSGDKQ